MGVSNFALIFDVICEVNRKFNTRPNIRGEG